MKHSIHNLFEKAKQKDEFELVFILMNYRGMGPHKAMSNLYEWFDSIGHYESLYQAEQDKARKMRMG